MNFNLYTLFLLLTLVGCQTPEPEPEELVPSAMQPELEPCYESDILHNPQNGCDHQPYPSLENSMYVLPFPPGESYPTGLTNCAASFHIKGSFSEYAFDFNMPNDTPFHAIRAGTVGAMEERNPNYDDGSTGNYVHVYHDDGTYALYYHSPPDGIEVEVGDVVDQGQRLGVTGTSGSAGYPHLHLSVNDRNTNEGVPIAFRNVNPRHTVLITYYNNYEACEY